MGRIYYVSWDAATAVTTSIDIFEIVPAANRPVILHELHVWQTSDVGDAQEELLTLSIRTAYTTSGLGGGSANIGFQNSFDSANGFTAEVRNTTLAVSGAPVITPLDGWNVRAPYIWTPTPEIRPFWHAGMTRAVVRLDSTPADSLTMNAMMVLEELG